MDGAAEASRTQGDQTIFDAFGRGEGSSRSGDGRVPVSLAHLRDMMVPAGIVQFADGPVADAASGTCLDDNTRAWIVAMMAMAADPHDAVAHGIGQRAFGFVQRAQNADGSFYNMADVEGRPLEPVGSEESIGRAVWACGVAVACAVVPQWREEAVRIMRAALPTALRLRITHARAYCILGLTAAVSPDGAWPMTRSTPALDASSIAEFEGALCILAQSLHATYRENARPDWPWWNESLTWGNGRLPEAMLRAAHVLGDESLADAGTTTLSFLAGITQPDDRFVPIGNKGWYVHGGPRAIYDQQPIEACGMTDAWLAAYLLTKDVAYLAKARVACSWFDGNNTEGLAVGVPQTGASHDGLLEGSVNPNQGAESTLSYLHARLMLEAASQKQPS